MISAYEVVGWLNQFSQTELSQDLLTDIEKIFKAETADDVRTTLLKHLESIVPLLVNPLEQAELIANLGALWYAQGYSPENPALDFWLAAHEHYQAIADLHRQTIVEWLLYIAYHNQRKTFSAQYWVNEARRNLWRLVEHSRQQLDAEHEKWYREKVFLITSEQIETPRYVYNFLFSFRESRLGDTASVIREQIDQMIVDGKREDAERRAKTLQEITRRSLDSLENAEALAYIGLIFEENRHADQAVQYWKESISLYIQGSHEYTLVAWMLALENYDLRGMEIQSIEMMQACIRQAEALALDANHRNNAIQQIWYQILSEAMRISMKRVVSIAPVLNRH